MTAQLPCVGDCPAVRTHTRQGSRDVGQEHCLQPPVASTGTPATVGSPPEGWGHALHAPCSLTCGFCLCPHYHAPGIADLHSTTLANDVLLLSAHHSVPCSSRLPGVRSGPARGAISSGRRQSMAHPQGRYLCRCYGRQVTCVTFEYMHPSIPSVDASRCTNHDTNQCRELLATQ